MPLREQSRDGKFCAFGCIRILSRFVCEEASLDRFIHSFICSLGTGKEELGRLSDGRRGMDRGKMEKSDVILIAFLPDE